MRRHVNNSSSSSRKRNPLLLFGLGLLLYALFRVYSLHADLHELHQSLNGQRGTGAAAPVDVQVIMPEENDMLFLNASSKGLGTILAYPHVDECRQCSVCIPQHFIDQQLGNGSRGSRWWQRRWSRQLLLSEQQQHEQQQQEEEEEVGYALPQLHWSATADGNSGASGAVRNDDGSSSSSRRRSKGRREPWLQRQQQWRAALQAAGYPPNSVSSAEQSHDLQGQQQKRQQQQSPRPRLDGVKTHKAWLAKQAAGAANTDTHAVPGVEVILNMPDNSFDWQGVKHQIGPTTLQMDQSKIRHCKACRGCQQHLTPMPKGIHWLGASFLHDPGASDAWLMTADAAGHKEGAPDTPQSVVKVWCVPVPKPGSRVPAVCKPSAIREQLQLVLALQNIAEDCQFGELLPRHWVGPVDGVLPGSHGYRVLWDGLWADLVVGVSAENLVHRGEPRVQPSLLLHYLQHQLNSTQVVMAAIFDLLFSQCDRHGQNLYLKPDGSLVLIDNDQSYGASWRPCGVDSLFLPGTQKYEIERLGFSYVMKKPEYAPPQAPSKHLDPLQLLDYRCHLPEGRTSLGTAYPKQVTRCLKRLSKMPPEKIASKYGYPHPRMAAAVHQRAKDMLQKGFEWTLQNGWPQNPVPTRYKWSKGCCKLRRRPDDSSTSAGNSSSSQGPYECTSWVQPDLRWPTDLPIGDPVTGLDWEHNGADTGTYNLERPSDEELYKAPSFP